MPKSLQAQIVDSLFPEMVVEDDEIQSLPCLDKLHERHFGLGLPVCLSYAQAASICLSRHHTPPSEITIYRSSGDDEPAVRLLDWMPVTARDRASWANQDDATRDGAYSLAIASAESELDLFAVARAETLTGSDYLLGEEMTAGVDDYEAVYRLEISGTDSGDNSRLRERLRSKVAQAKSGQSSLPALACVVGFRERVVAMQEVE